LDSLIAGVLCEARASRRSPTDLAVTKTAEEAARRDSLLGGLDAARGFEGKRREAGTRPDEGEYSAGDQGLERASGLWEDAATGDWSVEDQASEFWHNSKNGGAFLVLLVPLSSGAAALTGKELARSRRRPPAEFERTRIIGELRGSGKPPDMLCVAIEDKGAGTGCNGMRVVPRARAAQVRACAAPSRTRRGWERS